MHQHKIVAQILLMFSILNSVLAVPVVGVRGEIPGARSVAVRVPLEGVVTVLEKRPFDPTWETSTGPSPEHSEIQPYTSAVPSPEHSGPLPGTSTWLSPDHSGPLLGTSAGPGPEHHEIQPDTSAGPSPEHSGPLLGTSAGPGPEHHEIQPDTSAGPSPEHPGPQLTANPPESKNKAPSMPAWREKIMTPEKIKGTKYVAGAALFTTLYLGLLLPDIFHDDNKHSQS